MQESDKTVSSHHMFGEHLLKAREEKHLSRQELADQVNVLIDESLAKEPIHSRDYVIELSLRLYAASVSDNRSLSRLELEALLRIVADHNPFIARSYESRDAFEQAFRAAYEEFRQGINTAPNPHPGLKRTHPFTKMLWDMCETERYAKRDGDINFDNIARKMRRSFRQFTPIDAQTIEQLEQGSLLASPPVRYAMAVLLDLTQSYRSDMQVREEHALNEAARLERRLDRGLQPRKLITKLIRSKEHGGFVGQIVRYVPFIQAYGDRESAIYRFPNVRGLRDHLNRYRPELYEVIKPLNFCIKDIFAPGSNEVAMLSRSFPLGGVEIPAERWRDLLVQQGMPGAYNGVPLMDLLLPIVGGSKPVRGVYWQDPNDPESEPKPMMQQVKINLQKLPHDLLPLLRDKTLAALALEPSISEDVQVRFKTAMDRLIATLEPYYQANAHLLHSPTQGR
jgi:hypothetical protein